MIELYTERSAKRDHWPPGNYFPPNEYMFPKSSYPPGYTRSLLHAIPFRDDPPTLITE